MNRDVLSGLKRSDRRAIDGVDRCFQRVARLGFEADHHRVAVAFPNPSYFAGDPQRLVAKAFASGGFVCAERLDELVRGSFFLRGPSQRAVALVNRFLVAWPRGIESDADRRGADQQRLATPQWLSCRLFRHPSPYRAIDRTIRNMSNVRSYHAAVHIQIGRASCRERVCQYV